MDKSIKHSIVEDYNDNYTFLSDKGIKEIRKNYKIIDVHTLDPVVVNYTMDSDEYFKTLPKKKEIVNNMVNYYLTHKDISIYKITDYMCNEKEKICICNTNADDLKKSYGDIYDQQHKYISWCKKKNEHF
jgi:hypothetical protein